MSGKFLKCTQKCDCKGVEENTLGIDKSISLENKMKSNERRRCIKIRMCVCVQYSREFLPLSRMLSTVSSAQMPETETSTFTDGSGKVSKTVREKEATLSKGNWKRK